MADELRMRNRLRLGRLEHIPVSRLCIRRCDPLQLFGWRTRLSDAVTWQSCLRCRRAYPAASMRDWCLHCIGRET